MKKFLIVLILIVTNSYANIDIASFLQRAEQNNFHLMDLSRIREIVMNEMLGTEYVGGTLDLPGPEMCVINTDSVDCVTFAEYALALSYSIKEGNYSKDGFKNWIEEIRYRDGILDGYISRLHYYSDWINNNIEKGLMFDITEMNGGKPFNPVVNFMSKHPQYYAKLKNNPEAVQEISIIEKIISKTEMFYFPKTDIPNLDFVQTGDIIAFRSTISGLDYGHVGMAYRIGNEIHLLHASSDQKQVVLDKTLQEYISNKTKFSGITIIRPKLPNKND